MSTGSAKMASGGAGGLAAYLMADEVANYYAEQSGRGGQKIRSFGDNDVIFRADQVHGRGVEAMGIDLTNGMTFRQFRNLCEGKHADTGDQIVQLGHRAVFDPDTGEKIGTEVAHTMAIDTYYAAPKSVSVACIVAARHRPELVPAIIAAHQNAVREAAQTVENESRLGRRTVASPSELAAVGPRLVTKPGHERQGQLSKQQGSKSVRVAVDLIQISATQHTARPNDVTIAADRMPDPHLHDHWVNMGPGFDAETGKWVQIDDYGLKSEAVRRDANYMGALARNLQEVGLELEFGVFEEGRNGRAPWRVKGITEEAERFFSSNHDRQWSLRKDLEERLGKAIPEKLVQDSMRQSRRAKDAAAKRQDSNPTYELWAEDADRFGITLADKDLVKRLTADRHTVVTAPYEERQTEFFRRLYGEKGLTKDNAEFNGKTLAEGIARCAEGLSFTPDDRMHLELAVMDNLVVQRPSNEPAQVLYTTPAMLKTERAVADVLATKAKTTGMSAPTGANVYRAVSELGVVVDAEQMSAIEAASSGRGLTIINGWAGTGKTTSLKAMVNAGRMAGPDGKPAYDQVIVVSTASLTAQGTGAKLRADAACSIDGFLTRVKRGRIKPTDRTKIVIDEAAMTNTPTFDKFLKAAGPAQIVLVGDPEQAQPIGPGGTFQAAVKAHGATELTRVWRQQDHRDVRDLALLRKGQAPEMIDNLDARGRFHVSDTAAERIDMALSYYDAYRESGRRADEVRLILDSANVTVDECNRHIQRSRRERDEISSAGIEVEARAEDRRWSLHAGDLVMFLQPTKVGRRTYIANGTTGQIVKLSTTRGAVAVKLDDNRVVTLSLKASADKQPLGLAYAVHSLKYQGSEVPIVLAVPGGPGTTNKNTAYSTLSRCTEEAHVFSDRETHGEDPNRTLGRAWSESPAKSTASSRSDEVAALPEAGSAEREESMHARCHEAYLTRIERVAGPDVATAVATSPQYEHLQHRLDGLHQSQANERAMLNKALHGGDLGADPAATLDTRLGEMTPIRSSDTAMTLALSDRRSMDIDGRSGANPQSRSSDEAMRRALDMKAGQPTEKAVEQDHGHEQGYGVEI